MIYFEQLSYQYEKIQSLFSLLLLLSLHGNAQQPTIVLKETAPALAGFSPFALQRIDSLLSQYVDQHFIGGATALIAKDGKVVYYKAAGYHDADKKQPMQRNNIFRIASQTKAITSVAAMMLYEEGKFCWMILSVISSPNLPTP